MNNHKNPLIFIGAGGHAHVLAEIAALTTKNVIGYLSQEKIIEKNKFFNFPFLGDDDSIGEYDPNEVLLVNGLGMVPGCTKRSKLGDLMLSKGYKFATMLHPSVTISRKVTINDGVQIMAGAIVQFNAVLGNNSIINTGSIIDHETIVGKNCHLAPGIICGGNVKIGDNSFIGAGTTIINNINIGKNCIIGAGSVVFKNLPDNTKFVQSK